MQDSMTTREDIIRTSIALIEQEGYSHLTIRAINKKLKISSLSFYKYFDSKKALLLACSERLTAKLDYNLNQLKDHTSKEQLVSSVKILLDEIKCHPQLMDFIYFNKEQAIPALGFVSFHQRINSIINQLVNIEADKSEIYLRIWSIINGAAIMIRSGIIKYNFYTIKYNLLQSLSPTAA